MYALECVMCMSVFSGKVSNLTAENHHHYWENTMNLYKWQFSITMLNYQRVYIVHNHREKVRLNMDCLKHIPVLVEDVFEMSMLYLIPDIHIIYIYIYVYTHVCSVVGMSFPNRIADCSGQLRILM